jgi:hypothetical protein
MRNTNFYESDYNGAVFSGETRLFFLRFSKFVDFLIPLPDPYFSGALKSLKDINWEDRFDYGLGLEWRPFSKSGLFNNIFLSWIYQIRLYALFLGTEYLQYQNGWSWRPTNDTRYGLEYYRENNLYDDRVYWSEIWADASWRKTNFYVKDFNSWMFACVPKIGLKIFPEHERCLMPYVTGEVIVNQRDEFWLNRILAGGGIRWMPLRWNETMFDIVAKGLKLYIEGVWLVGYLKKDAPVNIPPYDFRGGINYSINWW